MSLSRLADTIIECSFYLIVLLVPLIWLPVNYELFEFNKITLTYILASIILGAWLIKAIDEKKLYVKRTPLDIPLLLFLAGNILATVFSMDWHMSVFGYYSRFNAGLLPIITYIFLYYALVTHFNKEKVMRLLVVGFASSVLVAIYAILQHPNPFFRNADGSLRGIDAGYWVQDAQVRAFSTLGQPNWLAAYLSIFFLIGTSFLLIFQKLWQKILVLLSLSLIFLGFTFTYSRGGTLGLIAGGLTFVFFLFVRKPTLWEKIRGKLPLVKQSIRVPSSLTRYRPSLTWPALGKNWLWLAALALIIVTVNFFFNNAFGERGAAVEIAAQGVTQLEIEGKQTGQIRLLVWKGAWDIFKEKPAFGSGLETFALSYYQHRPVEHNQTGEWDFLYNKAHNEYLNYLATTGLVGTLPYLALIALFCYFVIVSIYKEPQTEKRLSLSALFAAYVSYLIQNIFGFSVVVISILFFLIPAAILVITSSHEGKIKVLVSEEFFKLLRASLWRNISRFLVLGLTILLLLATANSWIADFYFAKGLSTDSANEAYTNLSLATRLRPDEPLFRSELAVTEASLASQVEDKEFSKELRDDSLKHIEQALSVSPNNLDIWRNKLRILFELINLDEKYVPEATSAAEKVATLAPTDAKIHYNLALFYLLEDSPKATYKANEILLKVIDWRPTYFEARRQLAKNYIELREFQKAQQQLNYILKETPDDPKTLKLLKQLK